MNLSVKVTYLVDCAGEVSVLIDIIDSDISAGDNRVVSIEVR